MFRPQTRVLRRAKVRQLYGWLRQSRPRFLSIRQKRAMSNLRREARRLDY